MIPRVKNKVMKKRQSPEFDEQKALFEWAERVQRLYPQLKLMHASLVGVNLTVTQRARAKAMGVKAGIPDIFLPVARNGFHGLYIQLKAKNGRASEVQIETIKDLEAEGYCAEICWGWLEAADLIVDYLKTNS